MTKMRVHVLGGFLGAGKTTLARALAAKLAARGERVAIVTNDQGHALVDTELCRSVADVREIVGGCFCCRYDELETALLAASEAGATVAIAEAVGSCTDLVATVLAPLADRHADRFTLAPLAVAVDPWRVLEIEAGRTHDDVAYLFRKQIEEADVVLLTRADRDPPDVRDAIRAIRADAAVVAVSGTQRSGFDDWLGAMPRTPATPLDIDYDRYADAEALLGWCNARVRIVGDEPFCAEAVARRFLQAMADVPIAHLKLTGVEPSGGHAAIVRAGDMPALHFEDVATTTCEAAWLVNARVGLEPTALVERLKNALAAAAAPARVEWEDVEAFRPSRPTPRHRYAFRCGSGDDASCCAAFYDRADVRALLGDSWHPGGVELTLDVAERLGLFESARVLDVACGNGTSLRALRERHRILATGMDAEPHGANGAMGFVRGDAHAIPLADESFDAVLCECALSTFRDQATALREMRRVLRYGGRVAITDMAIEGDIPAALAEWVHTGTCLARAVSGDGYVRTIEEAGLRVVDRWDASHGLRELLRRIKRNLVGAALAAASGSRSAPFDVKRARDVLHEAERAVDARAVRYVAIVAERT